MTGLVLSGLLAAMLTGCSGLAGFLGALMKIGYDGPVVPEPFVKDLATLPPADAARRVGDALGRVWSLCPGTQK